MAPNVSICASKRTAFSLSLPPVYTVAGKGTFVAERKEVLGVRNEELMKEFDEVVTELLFLATDGDSLKTRIEQLAKGGEAQ